MVFSSCFKRGAAHLGTGPWKPLAFNLSCCIHEEHFHEALYCVACFHLFNYLFSVTS